MQTVELIRLRIFACSCTFEELEEFMRRRRPRVMRDAIGVLLIRLMRAGRIRIINGVWETCRPVTLRLGPKLPRNVVAFRPKRFRYSSHPPFDEDEEEIA